MEWIFLKNNKIWNCNRIPLHCWFQVCSCLSELLIYYNTYIAIFISLSMEIIHSYAMHIDVFFYCVVLHLQIIFWIIQSLFYLFYLFIFLNLQHKDIINKLIAFNWSDDNLFFLNLIWKTFSLFTWTLNDAHNKKKTITKTSKKMIQPKTEQKLFVFEFEEHIFQLILLTVHMIRIYIHIWYIQYISISHTNIFEMVMKIHMIPFYIWISTTFFTDWTPYSCLYHSFLLSCWYQHHLQDFYLETIL